MFDRRIAWAVIALSTLMAGSALAQTTTTTATRTFTFGPIGIGSTQSVEVDLWNSAANSSTGTAASCTGTVTFTNAAGTTIGTAANFTATSGQISPVRLAFTASGGSGNRTVIRATVALNIPATTPRPPCSLNSSLEIFDTSSGATQAVVAGGEMTGYRN